MAILNINLLQQQQSRLTQLNQANVVAAIVAGTIVGLQLMIVAFLYSTIAIRDAHKNGVNEEIGEYQSKIKGVDSYNISFYPNMSLTQEAKTFLEQVNLANSLVDNHKYFSLYVSEVAINTPNTIRYISFSIDSNNRLLINGRGRDYGDVSKLAESFGRLTFAKSTNIQDAKLGGGASGDPLKIQFVLAIDLKSAAELKKLPTPNGERSNQQASPTPSASPRPSSSPAPGGTR